MPESYMPGLNPYFTLHRAQRAGISEVLNTRHQRVLRLRDKTIIEIHKELMAKQCPVFPIDESDASQFFIDLLIPEGTRNMGTMLTEHMDSSQHDEVLIAIGRTLRQVHSRTGQLPLGDVAGTLAVAIDHDTGDAAVYIVPPYFLAAPDERALVPEFFTDRFEWQEKIWEGWNDIQA